MKDQCAVFYSSGVVLKWNIDEFRTTVVCFSFLNSSARANSHRPSIPSSMFCSARREGFYCDQIPYHISLSSCLCLVGYVKQDRTEFVFTVVFTVNSVPVFWPKKKREKGTKQNSEPRMYGEQFRVGVTSANCQQNLREPDNEHCSGC